MNEFRRKHAIVYSLLAAALGLGAMALVDWLWTLGVDAGVLAGIDAAAPMVGQVLVRLVPFAVALALLVASGREGLLARTSGLGRGLACGAFLIAFSTLTVAVDASRVVEGDGSVPALGVAAAFVVNYLLVGLGEETLGRAVVAETLLEHFGQERRGILAACGVSGIIFGLMHLVNLAYQPAASVAAQVVSAAFAGVLLAAIYFRSGNIWATVILHALYDMAGSLSSLLQITSSEAAPVDEATAQALSLFAPMAFGLVLGCIALFLLRKGKIGQVQQVWSGIFETPANKE